MGIDLSRTLVEAPPIPSKWDIIPIHTSDRGIFKQCRRRWNWSSPTRHNLIPKPTVYGINAALWFGTGIHHALQHYYNPKLHQDPVVTWESWFELQWKGGLVSHSELKEYNDRKPVPFDVLVPKTSVYQVQGLEDLLPDIDIDFWFGLKELGIGMLKFYKEYAPRNDNFSVISVEHDFSVPILTPDGKPLYWVDHRTMPLDWESDFAKMNEFGPLMRLARGHYSRLGHEVIEKQVHAKGRQDLIIMDNETGRFGILDHKTTSRMDEDYPKFLELDEQCTTYLWAGESEAKLYDLEYQQLGFVIYQQLFKAFPKPPTITSHGLPSINRQTESTTAEMFEKCIRENNLSIIFEADAKLQAYYSWLIERGDKIFVDRKTVRRNKAQKDSCGRRLYYEALDMLNDPSLYPNPTRDYRCINCAFRTPCIAAEDGSDWQSMLEDGYEPNWDR